uniref:Uncharacterized protein n=1 Tax=Romanomermis culicivorax TaxID=13658 RepID=A0A915JE38_ROMCU
MTKTMLKISPFIVESQRIWKSDLSLFSIKGSDVRVFFHTRIAENTDIRPDTRLFGYPTNITKQVPGSTPDWLMPDVPKIENLDRSKILYDQSPTTAARRQRSYRTQKRGYPVARVARHCP